MNDDLINRKIQPRNLTARAERLVRGNPVTSRPESGVDNCYPGLEFDQRNLDKRFFPGLEFEFHNSKRAPILRSVDDMRAGRSLPIDQSDTGQIENEAIYLWAVFGTFGTMIGPEARVERFSGQDGSGGLSAWRVIHDLEPGPVALLLARRADEGGAALGAADQLVAETALQSGSDEVRRDAAGNLIFAVLTGTRAAYLKEGVINPDLYEPGDLTRSLCAPWQYDFTDCGCFYWASNKPDLIALEEEGPQLYNFQRAKRGPEHERSVPDVLADRTGLLTFSGDAGWSTRNPDAPGYVMNYQALINDWEVLSPVFNSAEAAAFAPQAPVTLPPIDVLTRVEVLRRLRYLATVEHGLMIEYLYAHYSIDAPRMFPGPEAPPEAARNFDIARSVLSIAIDEMRHFRWVNEILRELDEPMELGRIGTFGDLDGDNRYIKHTFALKPLTPEQLSWFIDVERPSAEVDPSRAGDTIDGLYTRLLLSIQQSTEFSGTEKARIKHLIKLIIDEGLDHFTRFSNVMDRLNGSPSETWLRREVLEPPKPLPDGHAAKVAQIAADRAYGTVLTTLGIVFSVSNSQTGEFLQAARLAMYALDDAVHETISLGGAPLFSLTVDALGMQSATATTAPDLDAMRTQPQEALQDTILAPMQGMLEDLRRSGSAKTADSMKRYYDRLVRDMAELM